MSATELANLAFHERVGEIPDVRVTLNGRLPIDCSFDVQVPDLAGPAADRVFDLEAELFRRFPGARLAVRVRLPNDKTSEAASARETASAR